MAGEELTGRVTTVEGAPIEGASIIASNRTLDEWVETSPDGTFTVDARGWYVSIRHRDYQPALLRLGEQQTEIDVVLKDANDQIWRLPDCGDTMSSAAYLVGQALQVRRPEKRVKGPVYGEHDAHWYVFGERTSLLGRRPLLHIVSGFWWHGGLPRDTWLVETKALRYRGWSAGEVLGMDISGENSDGLWRWVGSEMINAITYYGVRAEAAAYFDSIIETACFGIAPEEPSPN